MPGGHHIRAVGPEAARNAQSSTAADGGDPSEVEASNIGEEYADALEIEGELDLSDYNVEDEYDPEPARFGWAPPAIAIALIVGWTAFYGWATQDALLAASGANPAQWTQWIIDWSVPVLLVCVGWLITMRNSRAEARRFAETASMLSKESSELEDRLTIVNRELSLAREFLGAQSLELDSLGRTASERISGHAAELQQLIRDNGAQVEAIGNASDTALSNMTRLRDDLPVVANSARDVSNQIGNAGRTAQGQLDKLIAGFDRLNQFGLASETQVTSIDKRVSAALTGFETDLVRIADVIDIRLGSVQKKAGDYRTEVESAEAQALSALGERMAMLQSEAKAISGQLRGAEEGAMAQLQNSRERFEADVTQTVETLDRLDVQAIEGSQKRVRELHEEAARFDDTLAARDRRFLEEMTRRQEEFSTRETQASEILAQRLTDLDDALTERRDAQSEQTEILIAQSTAMTDQLDTLRVLIGEISAQSDTARDGMASGLDVLGDQFAERRAALEETEAQIGGLTEAGIRLLEIIQSGAKHSREELPKAIETASSALGNVEGRAAALSGMMFATSGQAEKISDYLVETQSKIDATDTSIEALQSKLSAQSEDALAKLEGLRGGFTRLTEQSEGFAGETQEQLRKALGALEDATKTAFTALEAGAREKVGALATSISKEAVAELERSLREDTAEALSKMQEAASSASGAGREAAVQLRDQLSKVNDLTRNLEQRVARARELAEEQVGNDFARRMALITDSLNSNAIDLAGAISTEVSDTAWDAYLKGDRGIFTRRAVRLIESGDAKEIAELYQRDDAFKSNVSRYIHDFEAMLRAMLSTRDGNALSVTILGSDMGKLYVVLAQSIERLRQ